MKKMGEKHKTKKEEWYHYDAPKAVNLGVWSMVGMTAFAFALLIGTALTQIFKAPILASQGTTGMI